MAKILLVEDNEMKRLLEKINTMLETHTAP